MGTPFPQGPGPGGGICGNNVPTKAVPTIFVKKTTNYAYQSHRRNGSYRIPSFLYRYIVWDLHTEMDSLFSAARIWSSLWVFAANSWVFAANCWLVTSNSCLIAANSFLVSLDVRVNSFLLVVNSCFSVVTWACHESRTFDVYNHIVIVPKPTCMHRNDANMQELTLSASNSEPATVVAEDCTQL